MDMPNSALAERIRERMDALGLNPYSAAKKAELGESFVRDILKGKVKSPSAKRLAKLALALECSLNYLLGEEELELLPDPEQRPNVRVIDKPSRYGLMAEEQTHISSRTPELLPIRYELMANAYRKATDVARKTISYQPATIPARYADRQSWWELVLDDSVERVAPPGSLVQVVELLDHEIENLQDGDFVVVAKRHASPTASFNLVERSMRRVTFRYPDLGLWFFEYAHLDPEMDLTDDIYKDTSPPVKRKNEAEILAEIDDPEERERRRAKFQELREAHLNSLTPELKEALQRVDAALMDKQYMEALLREKEAMRARIQGKVIRVLTALDTEAGFISRTI